MSKWVRKPSPAFVVSLVSLFVAIGGTGYAALVLPAHSVGTTQLKNGAVTDKQVKAGSLTGRVINLKKLGAVPLATKADTATNAVDATNATTADASPIAKVSYVVAQISVPVTTVTPTRDMASCPAGTVVTGGGASVNDERDGGVNDSISSGTSAWLADFYNVGDAPIYGYVEAICAPAAAVAAAASP
jgi:hypothetical protein